MCINSFKFMKKKAGQIFLVGSFLFIIMILGIGLLQNAIFHNSPDYQFEYLAKNIQNEMLKTLEYEIITGEEKIENFTDLTSKYLTESYPNANFMFIYGLENFSFSSRIFDSEIPFEVKGLNFESGSQKQFKVYSIDDNISITLNEGTLSVPIYPGGIAHFLIILEENGEVFIGFS